VTEVVGNIASFATACVSTVSVVEFTVILQGTVTSHKRVGAGVGARVVGLLTVGMRVVGAPFPDGAPVVGVLPVVGVMVVGVEPEVGVETVGVEPEVGVEVVGVEVVGVEVVGVETVGVEP
jgi:hypothetical protein